MGISFDAPLALLLLVPALLLTFGLHLGARRRMGAGRRRVALVVRSLLLAALVFALAGFQLVLPVDRLATVFVVDLSDSVGNAGREDALAFLRETLKERARGRRGGDRRVRQARRSSSGSRPSSPRSTGSPRRRSSPRPTSAPRCGSPRRCSRTTRRSGSSSSPTATTRPAAARPRRRWRRRAASRSRRGGSASGDVDEVLVERLTTPSTARLGEAIQVVAEIRSTVAQTGHRPPLRRRRAGRRPSRSSSTRASPGSRSTSSRPRPASTRFRAVVEAARDTFSQNDRADSNTIVKGEPRTLVLAGDDTVAAELVAALQGPAPAGRHDRPRGAADRLREPGRATTASSSSTSRGSA